MSHEKPTLDWKREELESRLEWSLDLMQAEVHAHLRSFLWRPQSLGHRRLSGLSGVLGLPSGFCSSLFSTFRPQT
eukprot:177604-Rhodomonas_salina.1